MAHSLTSTHFTFPEQKGLYVGKVRDVYTLSNDILVMIVTDRISAFDVVLPKGIPFKGQVLNQIASKGKLSNFLKRLNREKRSITTKVHG